MSERYYYTIEARCERELEIAKSMAHDEEVPPKLREFMRYMQSRLEYILSGREG